MPANVLQRELDAYADALESYQRQLQSYNTKVTTFNESFLTDSSGKKYIYQKPYQDVALIPVTEYWPDNMGGVVPVTNYVHQPFTAGNKYYIADASGKLTETSKPGGTYGFTDIEGNFQALRINPDLQGQYPTKPAEWTKTFDKKPVDPTTAQMRKLDEPSLTDVERNTDKGLISSAFNF